MNLDCVNGGISWSKGWGKPLIGNFDVVELETIVEVLIQNVGYVRYYDQHKQLSDASTLPSRYCVYEK